MANCTITGCALYDSDADRHIWGDLHRQGDQLIHVGVESGWREGKPELGLKAVYVVSNPTDFFERRGVSVFSTNCCTYNNEAFGHLLEARKFRI